MATLQMKKVPLLDLAALHTGIQEEISAELNRVIQSQRFIMGEDVALLEKEIAQYCNVRHAAGCASGSDALYLALLAAGIVPGDHVLIPPYTFFATAGSVTRAGAVPVFADVEPATLNIDVELAAAALKRDSKIRAIIPVHLFGACADMDPILCVAREHGCLVIEDGAQAIGSEYKGRRALSIGDIGCLSFFPSKNLGAYGDGGMVTANDEALFRELASLRVHGSLKKYFHESVGINSRLDTLQAAVLRVKLRYLDGWTAGRQRNADLYRAGLKAVAEVTCPVALDYQTRHIYNQFVIRVQRRDQLRAYLEEQGVGTEVYYPLPLHLQPCYRDLGYSEGAFPVSEVAAKETLALPIHSALPADDLAWVCDRIQTFYRSGN